jgi:sensor histidine kinase YesM
MRAIDPPPRSTSSLLANIGFVVVINLTAALTVAVLREAMDVYTTIRWAIGGFIISIVFAISVWSLAQLSMPHLAPRFAAKRSAAKWSLLIATLLVLTAIGSMEAVLILIAIDIFPRGHHWEIFFTSIAVSVMISLAIGVGRFIYEGVRSRLEEVSLKLQRKELEEERARKLAIEARLSSLESRIHPHFLFNTLNSISSLIQEDPVLAERLVERLSALLRFSLDSNQHRTVALRQEMKIVVDYLEIEKARYGERLRFQIDIPPELEPVAVPPLSIQTLVENSVKHAVSTQRGGATIEVRVVTLGEFVRLEVSDDGPGFTHDSVVGGHGLDTLQARLNALFGASCSLDVITENETTLVRFCIPKVMALADPATIGAGGLSHIRS